MTTCGEHLIQLLEQRGVTTVFGIPGVHTLELYRGLAASGIHHVTARHEQGAGFMADGSSRVRGLPGVAIVITGPGVTNAMTPLGQARHDGTPLLVISASVKTTHRGRQRGVIHDLPDQAAMTRAVTRRTITIDDPARLADGIAEAWSVLSGHDGPIGPVHLEVPMDVLQLPAADGATRPNGAPPAADPDAIAAATALLAAAARPALILGGGARAAGPQALTIAERLGAPLGLTINAKGAVPGDHALCVPSRMMFDPLHTLFTEADVLLVVGSQLSDLDWWTHPAGFHSTARIIRIDTDPQALGTNATAEVALQGDAATTLAALAAAFPAEAQAARAAAVAGRILDGHQRIVWPQELAQYLPTVQAIDRALPRDRIVAVDSTQPGYAANHALDVHLPGSWLMPIGFGCLGPALPMAIGAKLAAPERPVLAIAGDGGVLFTLQELATAVDQRLALPIIVWNNGGYGEIRDAMGHGGIEPIGTDATAFDFPAIARGFGCHGVAPASIELVEEAVRAALEADRPTLIEVRPTTAGAFNGG